jgi:molybdate/tungstate transport system substrate-binding protein
MGGWRSGDEEYAEVPRRRVRKRLFTSASIVVLAGLLLTLAFAPAVEASRTLYGGGSPATCTGDAGSTINVLHAGSLSNLVKLGLAPAMKSSCGVTVTDQSGPAVQLAEEIKAGTLSGDVYMSADAHVNKTLMGERNGDWVRWYLAFARNEEVISYTPQSPFFAELEKARLGEIPWYKVLMEPGFVLGRTDPNTDPGGYYALFVAELAQRYYGIPGLEQSLFGSVENPAEVLAPPAFTNTVSGAVPDATFGYLSSAIYSGSPYIALPPQINLSDLNLARFYSQVSYTNNEGVTFRGAPIYDSVTVLQRSTNEQAAIDFVHLLLSPQGRQLVHADGFLDTPLLVGGDVSAVPSELRPFIQGRFEHGGGGRRHRHRHAARFR